MQNTYRTCTFDALTSQQLYAILRLRSEVFVVEQNAVYLDPDGLDDRALHVCMLEGETLIGYARLLAPGMKFPEATMGRIVLAPTHRGTGLGRQLIIHCLTEIRNHYGPTPICIEALHSLEPLYQSLGFTLASEPYDWGGVTYVKMLAA